MSAGIHESPRFAGHFSATSSRFLHRELTRPSQKSEHMSATASEGFSHPWLRDGDINYACLSLPMTSFSLELIS
jgi:hypothetical protein